MQLTKYNYWRFVVFTFIVFLLSCEAERKTVNRRVNRNKQSTITKIAKTKLVNTTPNVTQSYEFVNNLADINDEKGNQYNFEGVDVYVLNLKTPPNITEAELVKLLVKPAKNNMEKARAIYMWLVNNISYDTSQKIYTAKECFEKRKGVCEGYARLCNQLCLSADLDSELIVGYGKDILSNFEPAGGLRDSHAWNMIDVDGKWILIDATWGAGVVKNNVFTKKIKTFWFNPNSSLFIFTHFPVDIDAQLLDKPISEKIFWSLPPIIPDVESIGFSGKKLLDYFIENPKTQFPDVFIPETDIKVSKMPVKRKLSSKKEYTFEYVLPSNTRIILINNKIWHRSFSVANNVYSITVKPDAGSLKVAIYNPSSDLFGIVFEYAVK